VRRPSAARPPAGGPPRPRVCLISWNDAEAAERIALLAAAGHPAERRPLGSAADLRAWREDPPAAVVVDLGRLPSQGCEVAVTLRRDRALRAVPLVFAGGAPEKVARVRDVLPDAAYADWPAIGPALDRALAAPPATPVVPASFAAYAGTPLPKKLGIAPGDRVALVGAPDGVEAVLGPLPDGAETHRDPVGSRDLTLWFVRSAAELAAGVDRERERIGRRGLWICWPKKASGVESDLSEGVVRATGLGHRLVDFKICAVDETWSGLRFAVRAG
jgi:hypothetical protein